MTTEKMNEDVFKYGDSVGFFDRPKAEMEQYCKEMTENSAYTYDWHYVGGRAHVKRLRKGFVKEQRYTVFKNKDLDAINVTREESHVLMELARRIREHREAQGKKELEAVVIESDWACYDSAWGMVMGEWAFEQEHKSNTLKPSE